MLPRPNPVVVEWLDQQATNDRWTTAITLAELEFGVARLPDGRRKRELRSTLLQVVAGLFEDRIAPFDSNAARLYGGILTSSQAAGKPMSLQDAQIAAIWAAHGATLATRNIRDFEETGIPLIYPWSNIENEDRPG